MVLSRGVWYMVLASFWFSWMAVFVKLAGQTMPTFQIVLARALVSLILSWLLLKKDHVSVWGHRKDLLLLRGFLGFMGLICFFYAINRLPLGDVTVLHYTNPIFTALFAAYFLKEGIRRREVGVLMLCLLGVVLVARPGFLSGESLDPRLVGITLAGALFAAGAYTVVRKLGQTEHHLVVVFYFPLVATPASIPFLWNHAVWPTGLGWIWLLAVGVTTQLAQVYLTKGLHAERAGRALTVGYTQIIFAVVWGLLIFGERVAWTTMAGAVLITVGVLLLGRGRPGTGRAVSG